MDTQIIPSIQRMSIAASDTPSSIEIVSISVPVGSDFGRVRYSDIKQAIITTRNLLAEDVYIDRPRSAYDCTGQSFTVSLERVKEFLNDGFDGPELVSVYMHQVNLDV